MFVRFAQEESLVFIVVLCKYPVSLDCAAFSSAYRTTSGLRPSSWTVG